MKEATGELNMTVVTVVAIAAVAAFFYAFVWPAVKNQINRNTYCAAAVSCGEPDADGNRTCQYVDEDGDLQDVLCPADTTTGGTTGGN